MSEPWWQAAFGPWYEAVYAHRDDASASAEIAGLLPRLRAVSGPILDACCGNGRHLAALRAAGLDASGFDWSPHLIERAAARPGLACHVLRADVRHLPYAEHSFAAITVLFTAFGYFDDSSNAAVLAALSRLLAPGGWLVLDLPDRERLVASLVRESERMVGEVVMRETRTLSPGARNVTKIVQLHRFGEMIASWEESVRLYDATEIADLARGAGLRIAECWPGLRGPEDQAGRAVWWLTGE